MSEVILVEAAPWRASDGAAVTVRLAGGGSRGYDHLGTTDWRSGIVAAPRIAVALGFGQNGWTGGGVPQTSTVLFHPADTASVSELAGHFWIGAPITIRAGDDAASSPSLPIVLTGTVAAAPAAGNAIEITLADLSGALTVPVVTARFAGTGGIEGGAEAAERVKRRSWGRVFNVEGRIFDKANNIYEFGDPAFPLQSFDVLRDKGRNGPMAVLAWQGSVAETLADLAASAPPEGGGVVAPSIACAKWWTQPSGPLTADLRGEIGTAYTENAPGIASRIVAARSGVTIANVSAMSAIRAATAGIHVDTTDETIVSVLDRLLLPISVLWVLEPTGAIRLREWTWSSPVETLRATSVSRQSVYKPIGTRRLGYQRNHRQHSDAEISVAILAGDVAFSNGVLVDTLKDVEPGADVTADHVSADTLKVYGTPAQDVIDTLSVTSTAIAAEIIRGGLFRVDTDEELTMPDGSRVRQLVEALGISMGDVVAFVEDLRSVDTDGTVKALTILNSAGHITGDYRTNDGTTGKAYTVADEWGIIDPADKDDPSALPTKPLLYVDGVLYIDYAVIKKVALGAVTFLGLADQAVFAARVPVTMGSSHPGDNSWIDVASYTLVLAAPAKVILQTAAKQAYFGSGVPSWGARYLVDGVVLGNTPNGAGALDVWSDGASKTLAAGSHSIVQQWKADDSRVVLTGLIMIVDAAQGGT